MSLNLAQMAADLVAMEADLPDIIVMDNPDGRTLACSADRASQQQALKDEGFMGIYDLSVLIRASLLIDGAGNAAPLKLRQRFTHTRSGIKFRIEKLTDSQDGISVSVLALQVTS